MLFQVFVSHLWKFPQKIRGTKKYCLKFARNVSKILPAAIFSNESSHFPSLSGSAIDLYFWIKTKKYAISSFSTFPTCVFSTVKWNLKPFWNSNPPWKKGSEKIPGIRRVCRKTQVKHKFYLGEVEQGMPNIAFCGKLRGKMASFESETPSKMHLVLLALKEVDVRGW